MQDKKVCQNIRRILISLTDAARGVIWVKAHLDLGCAIIIHTMLSQLWLMIEAELVFELKSVRGAKGTSRALKGNHVKTCCILGQKHVWGEDIELIVIRKRARV